MRRNYRTCFSPSYDVVFCFEKILPEYFLFGFPMQYLKITFLVKSSFFFFWTLPSPPFFWSGHFGEISACGWVGRNKDGSVNRNWHCLSFWMGREDWASFIWFSPHICNSRNRGMIHSLSTDTRAGQRLWINSHSGSVLKMCCKEWNQHSLQIILNNSNKKPWMQIKNTFKAKFESTVHL